MADYFDPVPPPDLTQEDLQAPRRPEGWDRLLADGTKVLCGWTDDGAFHQYVRTEEIVEHLIGVITGTRRLADVEDES
jgi:hypothetical protein